MHTSWLLPTALLSTSVTAFYPYHGRKPSEDDTKTKRFFPISSEIAAEADASGVFTMDIKKLPSPSKRNNQFPVVTSSKPSLPNAVAIDEDGQDLSYFSTIKFGSKEQDMYMLIDTGSANTWVMGTECTSQACQLHNLFGPQNSNTINVTKSSWSMTYGTGTVEGIIASDTVAFANYSIELGFGLATQASNDFDSYPMDGILGLGLPSANGLGTPTIMQVLDGKNELKENLVGIHLQRNSDGAKDGEITFGGIDTTKFMGDISYTKILPNDNNWEIPATAGVDGVSLNVTGKSAVIDTGTSYILMPPLDAQTLHSLIPGAVANGEYYNIPCSTNSSVQFTFSNVRYEVSSMDYVGKASGNMCASNIIGHQAYGPDQWILGDVFLKNVYAVFDYDKARIGFGTKTGVPTSSSSAPPVTVSTKAVSTTSSRVSKSTSSVTPSIKSSSMTTSSSSSAAATSSTDGSPLGDTNSAAPASNGVRISLIIVVAFLVGILI